MILIENFWLYFQLVRIEQTGQVQVLHKSMNISSAKLDNHICQFIYFKLQGGENSDIFETCYPPLEKTVSCLSKLYRCLEPAVFTGLAQVRGRRTCHYAKVCILLPSVACRNLLSCSYFILFFLKLILLTVFPPIFLRNLWKFVQHPLR